ncbi:hypothetical protein YPPY71_4377, partial [Yersinia pestis PY-71]
MASIE